MTTVFCVCCCRCCPPLSLLLRLLLQITAQGYGSLETTPAFYALCLVDPFIVEVALGLGGSYMVDYKQLWNRVAADLSSSGVKFVYNADISSVKQASSRNGRLGKSIIRWVGDEMCVCRSGKYIASHQASEQLAAVRCWQPLLLSSAAVASDIALSG